MIRRLKIAQFWAIVVTTAGSSLSDQMLDVRKQIQWTESQLIQASREKKEVKTQLLKIKSLIDLQERERALGQARLKELEDTVLNLETRRVSVLDRIASERSKIRRSLKQWLLSDASLTDGKWTDPMRKWLVSVARLRVKEIETFKADLFDADLLSEKIQHERDQVLALVQELEEKRTQLAQNRAVALDLLKSKEGNRVAQLEQMQILRSSQRQIEGLIRDFNARQELQNARVIEKQVAGVSLLQGKLPLPIDKGRILSRFGSQLDPKTRLSVFKKGIEISADPLSPVRSVAAGRVAYAGELPGYGRVAILDHGSQVYTLMGHLSAFRLKVGDRVEAGSILGETDSQGGPLYFEVRSRNVAVNPLQWIAPSITLVQ